MRVQVGVASSILFSLVLSPTQVAAQTQADVNAASRQGDAIQKQQQLQLQQDQQAARRAQAPNGVDLNQLAPAPVKAKPGSNCQQIDNILVIDAPSFSDAALARLNREFAGKCLAVKDIEAVLASVTRFYIEKGYVTTRAYLPEQDLSTHRLIVKVVIGVVKGIRVDDGDKHSISTGNVFPNTVGKAFNLRDFEQGIDQINRLASNNAQLDIAPGDAAGESVVVVHNNPAFPVHLLATYDNQGSVGTGRHQAAGTVGLDNTFGLDDFVSVTHRTSIPARGDHTSSTDDINASIPFGYTLLTVDNNASRYKSALITPGGQVLMSSGTTHNRSISANRVNYRDQNSRWSTSASLSAKSANNYLAGQLLGVNSRNLAVLDLGTNYSTALGGGYLVAQLDYQRGLKSNGALHDMPGLAKDSPHAQFNKWTLDLDYTRGFAVAGQEFAFDSHFNGQYAPQALFGSEQIAIGGIYSVRGFDNVAILGDRGYFIRNELSMPNKFELGGQQVATRLRTGFDIGHVTTIADGLQQGILSGASVGMSVSVRGVTVDVFASKPVRLPRELKRETAQTWFRLSYGF